MISVLLCVFCCACIILWRGRRRGGGGANLPPKYPGQLPFIGHAYLFLGDSSRLWTTIKAITTECINKGGVIHFYLGSDLYYAISDPDDILKVSNSCLQKHFAYKFARSWLGDGLGTASGKAYALNSIKVALAHFFRAYRVTSDLKNIQLKLDFDLKPESGYEISLERRF